MKQRQATRKSLLQVILVASGIGSAKENKKGDKQSGMAIVITLAAFLLFLAWLFAFGGTAQFAQGVSQTFFPAIASTPVNQTYQFITYRNSQWGFSVQYPVGFIAEEPTLEAASQFRAYASTPNTPPEVIEVLTDNTTNAEALYQDLLTTSSEAGSTTSRTFTTTSGQHARLVTTKTLLPIAPEVSNEGATIYQAAFDCTDSENNPYVSLVLVTIPASLQQDNAVAEFVINSYRC